MSLCSFRSLADPRVTCSSDSFVSNSKAFDSRFQSDLFSGDCFVDQYCGFTASCQKAVFKLYYEILCEKDV